MIVSLLLLVGVAVAVPVPEVEDGWLEDLIAVVELSGPIDSGIRPTRLEPFKDALGPDINVADPKWILQLYNALGKRQVEDGWLEDLIAVVELSGPIDSGIRPTRLEPVKSRRTLPPLLAALDPEVLLKYLDKRQTEDNILEDIVVGLISTGLFPLGGGKREIEDGLWDDIVSVVTTAVDYLTDPEIMYLSALPTGKRQVEDGLWEDVVNAVVTASNFVNKAVSDGLIAYYTSGKRQSKRLLGTASENPIDLEKILQLINAVGKRQVEDGLWEDIVSFLVKTSEEINEAYTPIGKRQVEDGLWEDIVNVLVKAGEALSEASGPVGKRQVEDGLWEDIVNVVVKAGEALIENSGPLGKRQVKKERRLLAHLVTLVYPIFDGVGKRQA